MIYISRRLTFWDLILCVCRFIILDRFCHIEQVEVEGLWGHQNSVWGNLINRVSQERWLRDLILGVKMLHAKVQETFYVLWRLKVIRGHGKLNSENLVSYCKMFNFERCLMWGSKVIWCHQSSNCENLVQYACIYNISCTKILYHFKVFLAAIAFPARY